jgi:hypothetical protein
MERIRLPIRISPEKWTDYYRGEIQSVIATALDGRTIQLRAHHLRPFVTQDGILGLFEIQLDAHRRLVSIRKIA